MTGTAPRKARSGERPLSPHLQVYRPQLTSVMSITHRATGFALAAGTLMAVWMLAAAAAGPDAFETFAAFTRSAAGRAMLAGWSAALFYHLCNGVRHLFWDAGKLLEIGDAYRAGYAVLAASLVLTVLFWREVLSP